MNPQAPEREARRTTWTLVLVASAFLTLVPGLGLVSPRSRSAAEPSSENRHTPEHEPPPSPLVAPRPAPADACASTDGSSGRESAHAAEDAGSGPEETGPASIHHAPDPARLEIRVTSAGRAAPAATVELVGPPARGGAAGPTSVLHTSDADGWVRLELPPGKVRAAAWSAESCALPASGTLVAGELTRLELELEPAFPVAGRVLDARTGAPIAGAEVALWTFAERDTVTSASDGSFRHPRFPARAPAQQIVARAAGHGVAVRYLRIDPDGAWKIPAASAGEESLRGTGTPWVELALVSEQIVRGRVLDEGGQPLAGARVAAEGFFHALPSVATRDGAETSSDADGRFELTGLRSDIGHSLWVEAAGHAAALRELEPDPAGAAGALDVGEIVLARECVLAGFVVGPEGLPLCAVEVVLRLADEPPGLDPRAPPRNPLDVGARLQGRERRTRTDVHGAFVFEGLAPGPLVLRAEHGAGLVAELELRPRADGSFEAPCLALALDQGASAQLAQRTPR